jgi:hypothetical protein
MSAAEQMAEPITEMLTWEEMKARFPDQYVLVVHENEDNTGPIYGRVVSHGRDPIEVGARGPRADAPDVLTGLYYTGIIKIQWRHQVL